MVTIGALQLLFGTDVVHNDIQTKTIGYLLRTVIYIYKDFQYYPA